ncbi:hypothetical protein CUMW_097240 [Citrus unshiu]|uniref:Uncharacterized protein n=1 Tax=Citrus unshiu TaxID=55188 RepID=A0A2H5P253_CITUN|nr:hypothetical protein CUMW_097240 [Citrus unshiu]
MASSRINFAEGDVLQTLEPNSKESSRKYWLSALESVMKQWGLCGRFISMRRPLELLSLWAIAHNV